MAINITLDSAEVQRVIDALPATIFKAQRSAIGTTTTWAKKELQNRMSNRTGIPKKVFRRFGVDANNKSKSGRVSSFTDRPIGKVWIGLRPIKASYVGEMYENSQGAVAGDYLFPKGFVATMNSGHTGIYKRLNERTKTGKWKLEEQTVDLQLGFEVAEEVAIEAQVELRNRFAAKVRELNPNIT